MFFFQICPFQRTFPPGSASPKKPHIAVQPWEGMKGLVWLRMLLCAGRPGSVPGALCSLFCVMGGHQEEDFEKTGNRFMHNPFFFQVQLSNLALTYCRKDFMLFATPGRTRFVSQNTYSFSFRKLPLQIFPSFTARL